MMWEGHRQVFVDLKKVDQYNAVMPDMLDIGPAEKARFEKH